MQKCSGDDGIVAFATVLAASGWYDRHGDGIVAYATVLAASGWYDRQSDGIIAASGRYYR